MSAGIATEIGMLGLLLGIGSLFSEGAKRLGQSSLLGELLVGVILGPSLLGWLSPSHTLELLMEIGLILLLVETGIETDWRSIVRVGGKSTLVAAAGVIFPWVAGTGFALLQGLGTMASLMVGATLTATSIGITAKTLGDLRLLNTKESQIILGAAVLDDVIGLGILGIMQSVLTSKTSQEASGGGMWIPIFSLALIGGLIFVIKQLQASGRLPRLGLTVRLKRLVASLIDLSNGTSKEVVLIVGLTLLGCWAVQSFLGISMALAAFAIGLVLRERHDDPTFKPVLRDFSAFATIIIPLFFIGIGMQLDLRQFNPFDPTQAQNLVVALVLTVIAIATKAVAGFTIRDKSVNSAFIGMGMVPRGEVGLIFVTVGKSVGVLNEAWANILIVVVILSTFIAPILLKATIGNMKPTDPLLGEEDEETLHEEIEEDMAEAPHFEGEDDEGGELYERLLADERTPSKGAPSQSDKDPKWFDFDDK